MEHALGTAIIVYFSMPLVTLYRGGRDNPMLQGPMGVLTAGALIRLPIAVGM